jgi:hypothetical protein
VHVRGNHVHLKDLAIRGANRGVTFNSNRYSLAERLLLYSNVFGIVSTNASALTSRNIRVWNNDGGGIDIAGGGTQFIQNATLVGNHPFSIRLRGTFSNVIQNNIFYLTQTNDVALDIEPPFLAASRTFIDYNIYYMTAAATSIEGTYTELLPWQRARAFDYRSNITNPLLQDAANGDFHVKSQHGRFQNGAWVNDAETSWAVDHGNPFSSFTNEPATNGNRVNIGAYGNTGRIHSSSRVR